MVIINFFIWFTVFHNTVFIVFSKCFFNISPYIPLIAKKCVYQTNKVAIFIIYLQPLFEIAITGFDTACQIKSVTDDNKRFFILLLLLRK